MSDTDSKDETYSEEETVARREAALKRMLAMPHRPHKAKDATREGDEDAKAKASRRNDRS